MIYTRTEAQCADIFTKNFKDVQKWHKAVQDIGVGPKGTPPNMPPEPGPRPPKEIKGGESSGGSGKPDQSPTSTKKRTIKKQKKLPKVDISKANLES